MITPRQRNNLVLIQQVGVVSTDPQWGDRYGWTTYRQAWVSIDPQRGRETFESGETVAAVTHKIRGDYQELIGVTPKMRIVAHPTMAFSPVPDDARVFNILAVMPDFEGRGDVMISAEEDNLRYGDLPTDIPQ